MTAFSNEIHSVNAFWTYQYSQKGSWKGNGPLSHTSYKAPPLHLNFWKWLISWEFLNPWHCQQMAIDPLDTHDAKEAQDYFFFPFFANIRHCISEEHWLERRGTGMDRTRAHLWECSQTSGIPPCRFKGNTSWMKHLPRPEGSAVAAKQQGQEYRWHSWALGTAELSYQAQCHWLEIQDLFLIDALLIPKQVA